MPFVAFDNRFDTSNFVLLKTTIFRTKSLSQIKENLSLEKRISITPETAKNIINLGLKICIEKDYADLLPWIERMLNPKDEGGYESWDSLSNTLMPILKEEVGEIFLPWTSEITSSMSEAKICCFIPVG